MSTTPEHNLRDNEERYRRFVEDNFTGNFIMEPQGAIIMCNTSFTQIFGFRSRQEALAGNFMELLRSRKDGAELVDEVRQRRTVDYEELQMRQLDGGAVYAVARLVGIFDERDELLEVHGYIFNDTKRKRLEQQLIHAQKMEGLGTLAGGIAHDFNNILAIILGYTSRLETSRSADQVVGAVKVIREAVERGAALVQQLLTSARQAEARFSSVDLNALVRELEKMLQATFPKTINFELKLEGDLPLLIADRSQIHQVLLNLCVNARDAMPKGGTLALETCSIFGAALANEFTGVEANRYACVKIRDSGTGIPREVKAHIFEPFFTTKERGKGTGLGLSVVYGVVNNHRGFVQVESEPTKGTTFTVYLPLDHVALSQRDGDRAASYDKPAEAQMILLVEDEEMLRDLGVNILESEGYRVLAAKDGIDAVELFDLHRDDIGLVVCDLGLPRLGGREVFLKMKETKPGVRAIVASGYLEPTMRSEILKAGVIDTIQKPYDFNDLVAKIKSIIGPPRTADDHPRLF